MNCKNPFSIKSTASSLSFVNVRLVHLTALVCVLVFGTSVSTFGQCDNVTSGGSIGDEQSNCGPFYPDRIISLQDPDGGSGALEYCWLIQSASTGWLFDTIPGANMPVYDPEFTTETTCYQRLARRSGCLDYEEESNIVCMTVHPPITEIEMAVVPASCQATCDGILSVKIIGGTAPYSVLINGNAPDSISQTDFETVAIHNLCVDTYFIEAFDANDCSMSMFAAVTSLCGNIIPEFSNVPADLYLECTDVIPDPQTPDLVMNCVSATVTVLFSENTVYNPCGFSLIRTWVATDSCGNFAVATQIIDVSDTTPPAIDSAPADITIECGQPIPSDAPVFSDACDTFPFIAYSESVSSTPCGSSIIRSWTATDICGNSTTVIQNIDLVDSTPPVVISAPSNLSLECGAYLPTTNPEFSDVCDNSLAVTFMESANTNPCGLTLTRTWTATDACGNSTSVVQIILFTDTLPPDIVSAPTDIQIDCDQPLPNEIPVFDDTCDPSPDVTFTESSNPNSCGSVITRTWTATDACGHITVVTQVIDITDTTDPVVLFAPADILLECDQPIPFDVPVFSDTCDPLLNVVFTESNTNTLCSYSLIRTWTATDACGNSSTTSQTIQVADTTPPQIIASPLDLTLECGQSIPTDSPTFLDNCDSTPEVVLTENTTNNSCGYTIARNWTISDDCGNTTSVNQVIDVVDTTTPTLVTSPSDVALGCDESLPSDSPLFTDNCDPDPSVYLSENTNYNPCGYTILRTWTATDNCGNSTSTAQTITVSDNSAPTATMVPADSVIECDQAIPTDSPLFIDNCDPSPVTTFTENISNTSCGYTIVRAWSSTDACGNSSSVLQQIEVVDTTAPVVLSAPGDTTIECGAAIPFTVPEFADNCDTVIAVSFNEIMTSLPCGYVITRYWLATDDCGNNTSVSQSVFVSDTTAPVAASLPPDLVIECGEPLPVTLVEFSDNCSGAPLVSFVENSVNTSCGYTLIRIWTAIDNCGNSSTVTQSIDVVDTTSPIVLSAPVDITIECGDPMPTDMPAFFDVCDNTPIVSLSENTTFSSCGVSTLRTWTCTDACGNSSQISQTIDAVDSNAPEVVSFPMDTIIECGESLPAETPVFLDACDPDPAIVYSETQINNLCGYLITRTWVATDACGKFTSVNQTVLIEDHLAPGIVYAPADMVIECGAIIPDEQALFSDACDPSPVITLTETNIPSSCGYSILRTYTATDACGNSQTVEQTINVVDTASPTANSVPLNITIECDEIVPSDAPTFADNCDPNPVVTGSESFVYTLCGYTISRTWTATDLCGNSITVSQFIAIVDTTPPMAVYIPTNQVIECGQPIPGDIPEFQDNCTPTPLVTVTETTVNIACGYSIIRTWTAADDCGNLNTVTQTIDVVDTTAPIFTYIPEDLSVECSQPVPFISPVVLDGCDATPQITFSENSFTNPCGSVLMRTWQVTDACGNSSSASQIIDIVDSTSPVSLSVPPDVSIECDQALPSESPVFFDACDSSPFVVLSETSTVNTCGSLLIRTWTATDACGNSLSVSQHITISDTTPPSILSVPADVVLECGQAPPITVPVFADNCDASPTVVLSVTLNNESCGYTLLRSWTATDDCGNASSVSQLVHFTDTTAPLATSIPADLVLECDQAIPNNAPVFTDLCTGAPEVILTENSIDNPCGYSLVRTWTSIDFCGNTTSVTQTIDVVDTTAPVITSVPQDITLECDESIPTFMNQFSASDNCDVALQTSYSDTYIPQQCGTTIIRTYSTVDHCGNTSSAIQTITLVDTTAPLMVAAVDITVSCSSVPSPESPTVSDNCDTDVEISFLEIITGDCPYTINRIWTATDDCGNETTDVQHIQVEDNEAPLFGDFDPFAEMSCDVVGSYMPTATDFCSDEVQVNILSETYSPDDCAGLLERLYQATDHCGNHVEVTQIIQVIDTTPPSLINIPQELTILCESQLPPLPEDILASDNCDLNVTLEFIETESGSVCPYDIERTWIATDQCNNVSIAHQFIHVVFETGVVLQAFPNPVNNEFTITFSSPPGRKIQLGVFDVIGQSVTPLISGISEEPFYSFQVDASRWNDGIYLIMLVADDEVLYERVLVSNAN